MVFGHFQFYNPSPSAVQRLRLAIYPFQVEFQDVAAGSQWPHQPTQVVKPESGLAHPRTKTQLV